MKKNEGYHSVFIDLDETLYPKSNGVWKSISTRINKFIVDSLQVSLEQAVGIRRRYLARYGTTLMGLRVDYDIDPYEYLDFVHNIPLEDFLLPDPDLRKMLEKISATKIIFTNASTAHASRILQHLEIEKLFDQIIDIVALDFHNKPQPESYRRAITLAGISDPIRCVMVDDREENLLPANKLHMTTVLVGSDGASDQIDYTLSSISDLLDVVPELASS